MKNKKILSLLLSIVMTLNGLSANAIKVVAKEKDDVTVSDEVDNELNVNINMSKIMKRNYTYTEDGVVLNFEKKEYTSYLDVQDWIKYDLMCDPYNKNIDYPDNLYLFDWTETGEEVNILISKEAYGKGYEMGVFINEELGKINWDDIKLTCDFVYIDCLDFKDDSYDEMFEENIKGCEENGIPYGLVFELDMNQFEDYNVGKNDSITTKKY